MSTFRVHRTTPSYATCEHEPCACAGQILVKYWSNTGQNASRILVEYWPNNPLVRHPRARTLRTYWSNIAWSNAMLVKYWSNPAQQWQSACSNNPAARALLILVKCWSNTGQTLLLVESYASPTKPPSRRGTYTAPRFYRPHWPNTGQALVKTGQILVKDGYNTGHALVKYWLRRVKYWSSTGQLLVK
jgi:hypothetical protein